MFLVVFILGLFFGSFTNAAAWRIYQTMPKAQGGAGQKKTKKLSLLYGRSMCPSCKHELSAKDLVPVMSWLSLGGKCRYCKATISWQYPLIELLTGGLFVLSYYVWDFGEPLSWLTFSVWLVTLVGFMILTVIDARWKLLPFVITLPLLALSVFQVALLAIFTDQSQLSNILGFALFSGLFGLLHFGSKGKWLGFGDIPLIAVIALQLGVGGAFIALFSGSLIGSVFALSAIALGKRTWAEQIPFGPLLIGGAIFAQFTSEHIIHSYFDLLLF